MALDQIQKVPLCEIVYNKLKTGILEGDFRPLEKLNQSLLAKQLGVSRMPVRDALRMLERDGLVENHLDKGYIVATFSKDKLDDILLVRRILEPKAVLLAEKHFTSADIAQLENYLSKEWSEYKKGNWKNLHKLNVSFHFTIYNKCSSPLLIEMIQKLWNSFPKYILHEQNDSNRQSLQSHERILDYIKKNDFNAAAKEMEEHIHNL